jgi:hypothetical protein
MDSNFQQQFVTRIASVYVTHLSMHMGTWAGRLKLVGTNESYKDLLLTLQFRNNFVNERVQDDLSVVNERVWGIGRY